MLFAVGDTTYAYFQRCELAPATTAALFSAMAVAIHPAESSADQMDKLRALQVRIHLCSKWTLLLPYPPLVDHLATWWRGLRWWGCCSARIEQRSLQLQSCTSRMHPARTYFRWNATTACCTTQQQQGGRSKLCIPEDGRLLSVPSRLTRRRWWGCWWHENPQLVTSWPLLFAGNLGMKSYPVIEGTFNKHFISHPQGSLWNHQAFISFMAHVR